MDETSKSSESNVSEPVKGSIHSCWPIEEEEVEKYVSLPEFIFGTGDLYLAEASGNGMVDAGIKDGDIVLLRNQSSCNVGDIVDALDENGKHTLKLYGGIDKKTNKVILKYANEAVYPGKRILVNELTLRGVVSHIIRDLRPSSDVS